MPKLISIIVVQILFSVSLTFIGINAGFSQSSNTVSITVLDGDLIRCYPDSVVRIRITPNPTYTYTQILLDWGDGSPLVTINSGDSLERTHPYPIAQYLNDCTYGEGCSPLFNGFCFSMSVLANYSNGPQENNTSVLTFRFAPRPAFVTNPANVCAGSSITLNNQTCPSNDNTMQYTWRFPDGSTSTAVNPAFTFPTAGTYPVTLSATNYCGQDSTMRNIVVQPLAIAQATLDSGSVAPASIPDTICLSRGGTARFHAALSQFQNNYQWSVLPASDWQELGQNTRDTIRYRFMTAGDYRVILRVNNSCNVPSFDTIRVHVLASLSLQLNPQQDTCPSLTYSPQPLRPDAVYTINGMVTPAGAFPITLAPSGNTPLTVVVSAAVSNICESIERRDTFTVFPLVSPGLASPSADTTICPGGALLPLIGFPAQGQWSGVGVSEMGGQYFFNPDLPPANYELTYAYGAGDCRQSVTVNIEVRNIQVSIGGPDSLCIGTGEHQLQFMPTTGVVWSGSPGIIDSVAGIFNTDLAGSGTHTLVLSYTESGCTVNRSKVIEVVALPATGIPDSLRLCAADQVFNLAQLTNHQPMPSGGISQWSGLRITNTGLYNPGALPSGQLLDTVSLAYTIAPGCTTRDTLLLNLEPVPMVSAGPDTTFCNSGTAILTGSLSGAATSWSGPAIDANTGVINLADVPAGLNRYIFTYSPLPICAVSDTVLVSIVPGDGLTLADSERYLCDTATTVLLPAASLPGDWSGLPGITGNTLTVAALPPGNYPLTFTAPSLPEACRTQIFTVRLLERPIVVIAGDSTGCRNAACVQLQTQATNAQRFLWDLGDGDTSVEPDPCHVYSATGDWSVILRGFRLHPVSNEVLCSTTAQRIIAVREPPAPVSILAVQPGFCPPVEVQFQPNIIHPEQTYEWQFGNFGSHSGPFPGAVLFLPGIEDTTYAARLVTRNLCGQQEAEIGIDVTAPAVADIGIVFEQPCSGDTLILTNRSTGGMFSSAWTLSTGETFNTLHPPYLYPLTDTLPRTIGVWLTVENVCNADTVFREVTVNPTNVRATLSYAAPQVCLGDTLTFSNISTPGAPVRWETSDGNRYLGDTVRHVFTEAGIHFMTIFAYGCGYDSSVWPIQVWPPPALAIEHDTVACANTAVEIAVTGNVAGQILFYGTGDSTLLSRSRYVFSGPGEYLMTASGQSDQGCRGTTSSTILILAAPVAAGMAQDSICEGNTVIFQSQSVNANTCIWQFGDGESTSSCTVGHIYAGAGTYLARIIAISNLGCRDTALVPVFVRPAPSSMGINYRIEPGCSPTRVEFFGAAGSTTGWEWQFGDGAGSTLVNPTHTYLAGGNYTVTLIVNNEGICFDTLSQLLAIRGTPQFDTTITDRRCLPGEPWVMEVSVAPSTIVADMIVSGSNLYNDNIINRVELTTPGEYLLTVISTEGCEKSIPFLVPPVTPLLIHTRPDTSVLLCEPVLLRTSLNAADAEISWSPGEWLNDSTLLSPTVTPFSTAAYVVRAERAGCIAMDTVIVTVDSEPRIFFPNVFSPNEDGINDKYNIFCGPGIEQILSFRIYTRWGELITEKNNVTPNNDFVFWEGSIRECPANENVFAYVAVVELKGGGTRTYSGDITLLR